MKFPLLLGTLLIASLSAIDPYEGHLPPNTSGKSAELESPDDNTLLNLKKMSQDFVLETKEIKIPGFNAAFNPSIVRWNDSILLAFRVRNEQGISTFQIGLVWVDNQFNLISTPQILDLPNHFEIKYQDPRLVVSNNQLYIIYSNLLDPIPGKRELRRMSFAELLFDGTQFSVGSPTLLTNFLGESNQRWEKNWAPFDYNGTLLFTHSILPHQIFYSNKDQCDLVAATRSSIQWDWGDLRGGTPPLLENDRYLGFFHSCKNIPTVQSKGKNITHYFFGAYTFSPRPPFNITHISPNPIIGTDFYSGPKHNTWKPLRVVFPCGHISDDRFIWIAYGRQDHECWIAKLDKAKLLDSLIPVETQ